MIGISFILVCLVTGFIFLAYWIPKRVGYPKTGKYISIVLALLIAIITIRIFFGDYLFSKSDARNLLTELDIHIAEDFDIAENKSMIAPGDYYHTFTLSITLTDKERIINEIKRSPNFNVGEPVESYFDNRADYYAGPIIIRNYESEGGYIREYFEPQGKGYAPTWRKVTIEKTDNKLIFEDIDK